MKSYRMPHVEKMACYSVVTLKQGFPRKVVKNSVFIPQKITVLCGLFGVRYVSDFERNQKA